MFVPSNIYTSNTAPHTLLLYMPMTMHVCHSGDTPGQGKKCRKSMIWCPLTLHLISKPLEALVFNPKAVVMLSFQ